DASQAYRHPPSGGCAWRNAQPTPRPRRRCRGVDQAGGALRPPPALRPGRPCPSLLLNPDRDHERVAPRVPGFDVAPFHLALRMRVLPRPDEQADVPSLRPGVVLPLPGNHRGGRELVRAEVPPVAQVLAVTDRDAFE